MNVMMPEGISKCQCACLLACCYCCWCWCINIKIIYVFWRHSHSLFLTFECSHIKKYTSRSDGEEKAERISFLFFSFNFLTRVSAHISINMNVHTHKRRQYNKILNCEQKKILRKEMKTSSQVKLLRYVMKGNMMIADRWND